MLICVSHVTACTGLLVVANASSWAALALVLLIGRNSDYYPPHSFSKTLNEKVVCHFHAREHSTQSILDKVMLVHLLSLH